MSISQVDGNEAIKPPTNIDMTIQALSALVIGIGEFSLNNIGIVGEDHEYATAVAKTDMEAENVLIFLVLLYVIYFIYFMFTCKSNKILK